MIRLGMLDPNAMVADGRIGDVGGVVGDPWNADTAKALARKVTDESIVLLKDEGGALPLDAKKVKSIAVIGPYADKVLLDWYSGTPPYTVTPLAGIKARAGAGVTVEYSDGKDLVAAAALAKRVDVAVVVIGNHPTCDAGWEKCPAESDGKEAVDRKSLVLEQEEIAKAVVAANPRTVEVLQASFPYTTNWSEEHVPAIVEITHGSEEQGNGLADVLFGDVNPAGRLTQTWVKDEAELPTMMDYNIRHGRTYMYAKAKPLYAFGYGLSYTTFGYSGLKVSKTRLGAGETATVSVEVKNTGARAGDEVVQMYVAHAGSKVERPVEELKGFVRVSLKAGEMKTVTMPLAAKALAYWDEGAKKFVVEKDKVEVRVGASSEDVRLKSVVEVGP
jgi:beta-glucosidase